MHLKNLSQNEIKIQHNKKCECLNTGPRTKIANMSSKRNLQVKCHCKCWIANMRCWTINCQPDVVSCWVSSSSETNRTVAVEKLLKEGTTRQPHPTAGIYTPVRIQQQLLKHLQAHKIVRAAPCVTFTVPGRQTSFISFVLPSCRSPSWSTGHPWWENKPQRAAPSGGSSPPLWAGS